MALALGVTGCDKKTENDVGNKDTLQEETNNEVTPEAAPETTPEPTPEPTVTPEVLKRSLVEYIDVSYSRLVS